MAETSVKYSCTAYSLLLANLGFYNTDIPQALSDYLQSLMTIANRELQRAGIIISPGDLYDDQLQAMYAAWLYRNASKGLAKPPMLAQEIRDRQVEAALAAADEEADA